MLMMPVSSICIWATFGLGRMSNDAVASVVWTPVTVAPRMISFTSPRFGIPRSGPLVGKPLPEQDTKRMVHEGAHQRGRSHSSRWHVSKGRASRGGKLRRRLDRQERDCRRGGNSNRRPDRSGPPDRNLGVRIAGTGHNERKHRERIHRNQEQGNPDASPARPLPVGGESASRGSGSHVEMAVVRIHEKAAPDWPKERHSFFFSTFYGTQAPFRGKNLPFEGSRQDLTTGIVVGDFRGKAADREKGVASSRFDGHTFGKTDNEFPLEARLCAM